MNKTMLYIGGALALYALMSIRQQIDEDGIVSYTFDPLSEPLAKAGNMIENVKAMLPGAFGRSVTSGKGAAYYATIEQIGANYNMPQNLLSRVAYQESRFNENALNKGSGAAGMFQIVPKWHPTAKPYDWQAAAEYAAKYLTQLYKQFGSWSKALAAYNWGPGNLSRYGLSGAPEETDNYYKQILADIGLQPGVA